MSVAQKFDFLQYAADGSNLAAVQTFVGSANVQSAHTQPPNNDLLVQKVGQNGSPASQLCKAGDYIVRSWDGATVIPQALYGTYFA